LHSSQHQTAQGEAAEPSTPAHSTLHTMNGRILSSGQTATHAVIASSRTAYPNIRASPGPGLCARKGREDAPVTLRKVEKLAMRVRRLVALRHAAGLRGANQRGLPSRDRRNGTS
jgi:hypothetical protein